MRLPVSGVKCLSARCERSADCLELPTKTDGAASPSADEAAPSRASASWCAARGENRCTPSRRTSRGAAGGRAPSRRSGKYSSASLRQAQRILFQTLSAIRSAFGLWTTSQHLSKFLIRVCVSRSRMTVDHQTPLRVDGGALGAA